MRNYWLRDQEKNKTYKIYWKHGTDKEDPNHGDYYTKHHIIKHHRTVRPRYVRDKLNNIIKNDEINSFGQKWLPKGVVYQNAKNPHSQY